MTTQAKAIAEGPGNEDTGDVDARIADPSSWVGDPFTVHSSDEDQIDLTTDEPLATLSLNPIADEFIEIDSETTLSLYLDQFRELGFELTDTFIIEAPIRSTVGILQIVEENKTRVVMIVGSETTGPDRFVVRAGFLGEPTHDMNVVLNELLVQFDDAR